MEREQTCYKLSFQLIDRDKENKLGKSHKYRFATNEPGKFVCGAGEGRMSGIQCIELSDLRRAGFLIGKIVHL